MNDTQGVKETVSRDGFIIYPVKGTSMLPLLDEDHDLVRLEKYAGLPEKYDVALFERKNGSLVLHRVIEVGKKYCIFCGDNQKAPEKVPTEDVIAKAVGFFRDGEYTSFDGEEYLRYVMDICRDIPSREVIKKIPRVWKDLVALVSAALAGKKAKLGDGADYDGVLALAARHSVASFSFRALDKDECPPDIYKKWSDRADAALKKEILFDAERAAILAELEKEGIKYICLKGIVIKELYPEKGMREFADNDILYDVTRKADVLRIMTARGFEATNLEGVHDTYHKAPIYNFEFHKMLFSKMHPLAKHFADVWARAEKIGDGCGYRMTDEDFYLYFVAHFYKHFANSGSGLRYFCDLYYLKNKLCARDFDEKYVAERLEKANLAEFEQKASALAEKIAGAPEDLTYDDLCYVMESGTYGQRATGIRNGINKRGKVGYFFSRMFIPYDTLCGKYPFLRKAPILLPFCEVARLIETVFNKSKRSRAWREIEILGEKKEK
ncbi:MAG: nucleotidyltransferase family protein [Clostridia bacterium]|nr:nucleotidyltransferase family protein [Clostridia bacterium]